MNQTDEKDPLIEQAERLVRAATIQAVGIFVPLLDKYPSLRAVNAEQWDFIVTVAGIFMAASRLHNLGLAEPREEKLMEIVSKRLDEWKPDGTHAFEDCKGLFESKYDLLAAAGHDQRFLASDSVGTWIVWNIFGHAPNTDEECALVRATGVLVTHAFFDWWN